MKLRPVHLEHWCHRLLVVADEIDPDCLKEIPEIAGATVICRSEEAATILKSTEFSAILLDMDGLSISAMDFLLERRREEFSGPVIALSFDNSPEKRISSLDAGADAFVAKPYNREEIRARLESLLRRCRNSQTSLQHRGVFMNFLDRTVKRDGRPVKLTHREFQLLELFLSSPGQPVTLEQILHRVWGRDCEDRAKNLVHVHVSNLREKMRRTFGEQMISSLPGHGYVLN